MLDLPPRVFLEPVVVTAGRIARAQAGPAAGLERRVVLKIALGGRTPAGRAGAGGVPDLGQVPQPGPGVVAGGLEPVVAVLSPPASAPDPARRRGAAADQPGDRGVLARPPPRP